MGPDLTTSAAQALAAGLLDAVAPESFGPRAKPLVLEGLALLALSLYLLLAALGVERLARAIDGASSGPGSRAAARAAQVALALAACGLLFRIVRHPATDLLGQACRFDHLTFALLASVPLARTPTRARLWALNAVSLLVVGSFIGWWPLGVVLAGCGLGFAGTRWEPTRRGLPALVLHGGIGVGVLVCFWTLRSDYVAALGGVGLFTFVMLRHVSFAVEASRGATTDLAGYLHFLLFYPSCFGAVEVFREFRDRNLRGPTPIDYRSGSAAIVKGIVLAAIGVHIPMNEGLMTQSSGFVELWQNLLVLYLRAACVMMGLWGVAEAAASFLGVRLHPNFRGVLAARNPSAFWRAWRGTMANWLVQHVYIPLGGGRRRRTFNIGVVFAVSTAWHCLGIPYFRPGAWTPQDFLPIGLWGLVNFAGVAGHAWLRRARPPRDYGGPAGALVAGVQWALTFVFGSLTVALLGFGIAHQDRFAHVLRTLLGLGGW